MAVGSTSIDRRRVRRILVRSTNWIGDAVMTLPALEALRRNFPDSSMTVLAKRWVAPLFEHHPAVDRVICFDGNGVAGGVQETFRRAWLLRKEHYDLAILFQNAFRAALMALLGGARWRVGYASDGRGLLLTHSVARGERQRGVHQVEYYLNLLHSLGWEGRSADPMIHMDPSTGRRVEGFLRSRGVGMGERLAGLSPGAAFGAAKRWPPERFAEVGDRIVREWGERVILLGSPSEKPIAARVRAAMKHPSLDLCGETSLEEAIGLIGRCSSFVSNDSGPMHIAAALGVHTVAVFGSTDPAATGPRGPRVRVVRREMPCAPCLKRVCSEDYGCLLSIQPEEVWRELRSLREGAP
jgi:heptosyltransferase II